MVVRFLFAYMVVAGARERYKLCHASKTTIWLQDQTLFVGPTRIDWVGFWSYPVEEALAAPRGFAKSVRYRIMLENAAELDVCSKIMTVVCLISDVRLYFKDK